LKISKTQSCSIDGCASEHQARGYCDTHYSRWKRNRSMAIRPNKIPDEQRFMQLVDKSTGCWLWLASRFSSGYAQFKAAGKNHRAHRFSYRAFKGEIPKGLTLDHLCRVKHCVNPEHLEPVTAAENNRRIPKEAVCKRGHARIPGSRRCLTCSTFHLPSRQPEYRRKKSAASRQEKVAAQGRGVSSDDI